MGKGIQLGIATIGLFLGLIWFLSTQAGGEGTFAYYEDVGSFLSNTTPEGPEHRGLRVHGFVVDGSIAKQLAQGYVDFAMHDDGSDATLSVRYLGIDVPDVFADGAEVVVEGRVDGERFMADRVLAKCPSKYEVEAPGEPRT
jgi:cytochrome c-type biogenesis protein CcmE